MSQNEDGLPDHLRVMAETMAEEAERDPLRFRVYHETRRIFVKDLEPPGDGRSAGELRHAAEGGDMAAAVRSALLLEESGDLDGAVSLLVDAADAGDPYARFRLGFVYEVYHQDSRKAAEYYRRADAVGDPNGSGNYGRLLKDQGQMLDAEQAFGRCYERGGIRALSDHAGLMSIRPTASHEEISEVVLKLCQVEDIWVEAETEARVTGSSEKMDQLSGETGPPLLVFSGMWGRCDASAMEAGVRQADAAGSPSGAFHLGILLRERGEWAEAASAFARAGERGQASSWVDAAICMKQVGDLDGATEAARLADAAGLANGTVVLGLYLAEAGNLDGSIEANRRADAMGDKDGSFNLGCDLLKSEDLKGAEQAFIRAHERGHGSALHNLQIVRKGLKD